MVLATWITVVTLELIHASILDFLEEVYLLDGNQCGATRILVIHNKSRIDRMIDASFKFLPYQLWMVGYWPTMALTGNGELGFDSGEGA
jgi:hypothetical protein